MNEADRVDKYQRAVGFYTYRPVGIKVAIMEAKDE